MKRRILIVEDEPSIAENIRYALQTEGFDTICHFGGRDVVALLARETVDLIILDIGLPDINGLELCKAVRRQYAVPVIFLTARSDEIDRVVGLEIGADDYVVKPFSPRELSARVKAVLRRTRSAAGDDVRPAPPFSVDAVRRRITYRGRPLELSNYEYNILRLLIQNPGRVFTRNRLMDILWDEPETSMDRTVDAHIKNIRAKLKKIKPDEDPIQTRRGMGYSLKEEL